MTKGVTVGEEKIEVRLPAALKRQALEAARKRAQGNVSYWVRELIQAAVTELGIPEVPDAPAKPTKKKAAR